MTNENKLVFHASALTDYLVCPRMYKYAHEYKIQPKLPDTKLALGSLVHQALACYYEAKQNLDAGYYPYNWVIEEYKKRAKNFLSEVEIVTEKSLEKYEKDLALGEAMLKGYFEDVVTLDPAWFEKVLYVEQPFEVPVFDLDTNTTILLPADNSEGTATAYHAGTFDLVVEDEYGAIWVVDHKTTTSFPSGNLLRLNLQFGLYTLAARYLFPDKQVAGVIYNGLKKVDPKKAKTACFWRQGIKKSDNELYNLTKRLSAVIIDANDKYFEPHPGSHCDWQCPFTELCIAEEEDSSVDYLIKKHFAPKVVDEQTDTESA